MKIFLGTLEINDARKFVQVHTCAWLGSKTLDGRQRVFTAEDGEDLQAMREAFLQIDGSTPAKISVPPATPAPEQPDPTACIHRGSQRMAACCGGGRLNQWICRKIKQPNGQSVDCVRTLSELTRNRAQAGTANQDEFDRSIVACDVCSEYSPKNKDVIHEENKSRMAPLADYSGSGPLDSLATG